MSETEKLADKPIVTQALLLLAAFGLFEEPVFETFFDQAHPDAQLLFLETAEKFANDDDETEEA